MNKSNLGSTVMALVAIVIAIGACLFVSHRLAQIPQQPSEQQAGASTPGTRFPHGVTVGNTPYTPTNYALIESGTCFLLANFSITASTTRNVDCAITDIVAGDRVILTLAASTTNASQYVIKAAQASTTAGFATASLVNLTGVDATPAGTNGFGSSTAYMLLRAQ